MSKIFSFWIFIFEIGFAKSGTWYTDSHDGRRVHYFSVHKITNSEGDLSALSLIMLPFSLVVGVKK